MYGLDILKRLHKRGGMKWQEYFTIHEIKAIEVVDFYHMAIKLHINYELK
jgi:hypothetical protein